MAEIFDEAAFGALKAGLGDEMVEMLMGKYLTQMQEKVAELQDGITNRDMGVVRQQAHDLTSSSGTVGLGAMKEQASATEFAVKEGDEDRALGLAQQLVDMAPETIAAIRDRFPTLA